MPKQTQFKPKQTQSKQIAKRPKMNVNKVLTNDYEKKTHFAAEAKQIQFQVQNYTAFTQKAFKRPGKPYINTFFKKLQKFVRICLHYCAYDDILLHISKDIVLCN